VADSICEMRQGPLRAWNWARNFGSIRLCIAYPGGFPY